MFLIIGTIPEKISQEKPKSKQEPERTKVKPKHKSIEQIEVEESPLERLKRLENGKLKCWLLIHADSGYTSLIVTPCYNGLKSNGNPLKMDMKS